MIFVLVCIAGWNYFHPFKVEGFQSGNNLFDPLVACPAIRNTLDNHEVLLEGYTERDAVVSIKNTKDVMKLLNASYKEHGCEDVLKVKKEVKTE